MSLDAYLDRGFQCFFGIGRMGVRVGRGFQDYRLRWIGPRKHHVVHFVSRQSPREMGETWWPSPSTVDKRWSAKGSEHAPMMAARFNAIAVRHDSPQNVVSKTWQENHRGSSRRSAVKRRQGLWSVGKFSSIMGYTDASQVNFLHKQRQTNMNKRKVS